MHKLSNTIKINAESTAYFPPTQIMVDGDISYCAAPWPMAWHMYVKHRDIEDGTSQRNEKNTKQVHA